MIIVSPIVKLVCRIASFVVFALTIFAAYGGYWNPDYFTIPAVSTLFLPWLGLLTLVITIAWLATRNWLTGALGVLTLVASWGALGPAAPLNAPKQVPEGAKTFRLMTFNCLHLNDIKNPDITDDNRAVRFIINSGADIVNLQELENIDDIVEIPNLPQSLRDSLFAVYPYYAGYNIKGSDLKVLSKYPVELIPYATNGRQVDKYLKQFARFIVNIDGHKLQLINMHMASYYLSEKERQVVTDIKSVKTAKSSIEEFRTSIMGKLGDSFKKRAENVDEIIALTRGSLNPTIISGDFNDVAGSWAYRKLIQAGYNDAYAETAFGPTITYNQHMFYFHIDQVFYRGPIEPLSVKRLSLDTSDHYPLMAEFAFLPEQ